MDVVIYHNPACRTSRDVLGLIRNAGLEPHVIEYLTTPPSRARLEDLIARIGIPARGLLRTRGTPQGTLSAELGLDDPGLTDGELVDAMLAHPVLIERPIVVSPLRVRLCRPAETVLEILPPQQAPFSKEDGEPVIDERGRRVSVA